MVSPEGMTRLFAFDLDLTHHGVWKDLETGNDEWITGDPRKLWAAPGSPVGQIQWLTLQLRTLAESLATRIEMMGFRTAIAYSGSKGLHVYGFTGRVLAASARTIARGVLQSFGVGVFREDRGGFWTYKSDGFTGYSCIEIELFPKQDTIERDGLGNLMRLPLGINLKSGDRGFFLDQTKPGIYLCEADPLATLSK